MYVDVLCLERQPTFVEYGAGRDRLEPGKHHPGNEKHKPRFRLRDQHESPELHPGVCLVLLSL